MKTTYITNRLKLLNVVRELHRLGFGLLRIMPSMAPSGMYWRCSFNDLSTKLDYNAGMWLAQYEQKYLPDEIQLSIEELTNLFINDNNDFIQRFMGNDPEYVNWYSNMIDHLADDELPYAFADWQIEEGFWETTNQNKIKILPNMKRKRN